MTGNSPSSISAARTTVFTLAEIAAAMRAFNDGDANAVDTLAAIVTSIETHREATSVRPKAA